MSKTTITFKIGSRKNSHGNIEAPEFKPASESDRMLAEHLIPDGILWTHQCPDVDGKPGELRGTLQLLNTLAEAHGWDVKYIHDLKSEVPPHPLTFGS